MRRSYWVFDWLAEHGIRNDDGVARLLRDDKLFAAFSEAVESNVPIEASSAEGSIVAGAGMDLMASGSCSHIDCRYKQVNDLFRHAWHYFDRIIFPEALSHLIRYDALREDVADYLKILLYIERIGAASMVEFVEAPNALCAEHMRLYAAESGLLEIFDNRDALVEDLMAGSHLEIANRDEGATALLRVPGYDIVMVRGIDTTELRGLSAEDLKRHLISREVESSVILLSRDLHLARDASAPLTAAVEFHRRLLTSVGRTYSNDARDTVAFELALPSIENVPIDILLRVRQEEQEAFRMFRGALSAAIEEKIKSTGSSDPTAISRRLYRDYIEPELARIEARLSVHTSNVSTGLGVATVGAVATLVGLLWQEPFVAALGAATAAPALTEAIAAFNARREVKTNDMYFLFKAKHAG